MAELDFTWDETKARSNAKKHGVSAKPRLLIVVYAYRDREARIRIISARKAMPQERALYTQKARS